MKFRLLVISLSPFAFAPAAFAASALVSIDFNPSNGGGNPTASGGDVTGQAWTVGTESISNFFEFNGGTVDVTGLGTLSLTAAGAGAAGLSGGIGDTGGANVPPGLGVWAVGNSGEIARFGATATPRTLDLTFDKPVLLTEMKTNWWDGGANSVETWDVTIGGQNYSPSGASENGPVDLTAVGLTTTTIDGVTGVLLPAGTALNLAPSEPDTDVNNAGAPGTAPDGNLDNGVLESISFYVVPEPSAAALIGSIGCLLLLRRRRH